MTVEPASPLSQEVAAVQGSRKFWQTCADSYKFGSPAFYGRVAQALDLVAQKYITKDMKLADIGCGDGRFTRQLAPYCRKITGYEFSDALLEHARRAYALDNGTYAPIDLEADDWSRVLPRPLDVVTCLGVFATLHKPGAFESVAAGCYSVLGDNGLLVTRDTLAHGETYKVLQGEYYSHFRNHRYYYDTFKKAGFYRLHAKTLAKDKKQFHVLTVFSKKKPPGLMAALSRFFCS